MSLILLLFVMVLWMASDGDAAPSQPPAHLALGLTAMFAFYGVLVGVLAGWSRWLARRVAATNAHEMLRRFHRMMWFGRAMVPVAFGLGVFWLGWGYLIHHHLDALPGFPAAVPIKLPSTIVGIVPPLLAWMGLWWTEYPADRALREQNLLAQLESGLPVHAPPPFGAFFMAHLRLQVMFAVVPVLMIILLRDVGVLIVHAGWPALQIGDGVDATLTLAALIVVYLLSPELLRRLLHTRPLPDGPLRQRLLSLCDRTGLRVRDILLWPTQNYMGNAAVMGLLRQVRYILMTDLLVETMTDEQIEAVFAHEIGHVRHRHMLWYGVLVATFLFVWAGPVGLFDDQLHQMLHNWSISDRLLDPFTVVARFAGFWVVFGFLSRRFERQADVFAARILQGVPGEDGSVQRRRMVKAISEPQLAEVLASMPRAVTVPAALQADPRAKLFRRGRPIVEEPEPAPALSGPEAELLAVPARSYVGPYGATLFASALQRVASVNNIPLHRHEWLHGSIAGRMRYVKALALDPKRTGHFDRFMLKLYGALLFALCAAAGFWIALSRSWLS